MPKPSAKSAAVAALVTAVLPMQDIVKLSIKEACQRFADRAVQSQRAFAEMGKLHFAISACLKKGQTIYGELRKLGVKDSTISNASYAARVWADLIDKGHLKEPDFDTFTFADCLAICRAMGDKSQLRLAGPEVAAIVRAKPDSFDAELESIYATGFTVEEAEKQAKAEVEAKAKAEADQKAKAEAEAKAKAEQEKQAAVQKALADQAAQQAAATAAAGSTPTPETQPSAVAASHAGRIYRHGQKVDRARSGPVRFRPLERRAENGRRARSRTRAAHQCRADASKPLRPGPRCRRSRMEGRRRRIVRRARELLEGCTNRVPEPSVRPLSRPRRAARCLTRRRRLVHPKGKAGRPTEGAPGLLLS